MNRLAGMEEVLGEGGMEENRKCRSYCPPDGIDPWEAELTRCGGDVGRIGHWELARHEDAFLKEGGCLVVGEGESDGVDFVGYGNCGGTILIRGNVGRGLDAGKECWVQQSL